MTFYKQFLINISLSPINVNMFSAIYQCCSKEKEINNYMLLCDLDWLLYYYLWYQTVIMITKCLLCDDILWLTSLESLFFMIIIFLYLFLLKRLWAPDNGQGLMGFKIHMSSIGYFHYAVCISRIVFQNTVNDNFWAVIASWLAMSLWLPHDACECEVTIFTNNLLFGTTV